ncbi:MAG: hypothetical protein LBB29_01640, partial [Holosporaceae bacterium]|nr:hypothetical protein [Holosporaceae bacterium]
MSKEITNEQYSEAMINEKEKSIPKHLHIKKTKILKSIKDRIGLGDIVIDNRRLPYILHLMANIISAVKQEQNVLNQYPLYYTEFLIHRFTHYLFSSVNDLRNLLMAMKAYGLINCDDSKISKVGEKPSAFSSETTSMSEAFDFHTMNANLNLPYHNGASPQSRPIRNRKNNTYYASCMEEVIKHLLCISLFDRQNNRFDFSRLPVPDAPVSKFFANHSSVMEVAHCPSEKIMLDFVEILDNLMGVQYREANSVYGGGAIKAGTKNLVNVLHSILGLEMININSGDETIEALVNVLNLLLNKGGIELIALNPKIGELNISNDYSLNSKFEAKSKETNEVLFSFILDIEKSHGALKNITNGTGEFKEKQFVAKTIYDYFAIGGYHLFPDEDIRLFINNAKSVFYLLSFSNFFSNSVDLLFGFIDKIFARKELDTLKLLKNYLVAISERTNHDYMKLSAASAIIATNWHNEPDLRAFFDQNVILYSNLEKSELESFISCRISQDTM